MRPTGDLHIGNYLGAIKQFVELQEKYKTYFFIADLHAITEPQDPEKLANQTLDIAALYLACGLDPQKTTLFVQSHMPEHLELAHILGTLTPMGELSRMTQYKEKVEEGKPSNFGLFAYPVLMAADILVFNADLIPVGDDQAQHVEIAREMARTFNNRYGNILKIPKQGEFLANIARGAHYEIVELTTKQSQACQRISKELLHKGINLIAFDILGNYISEVNITCPGLLVEVSSAYKMNLAQKMIDLI